MLRRKLLPTFNSIPGDAVGGTSMVDLPLGLRYHAIYLDLGDTANEAYTALLGDIRVKINGKVQRNHSAAQLNAINAVNGSAFAIKTGGTTGSDVVKQYLPIYFAEPWRKDIGQAQIPAWNLAGPNVGSFQIEVDWATGSHAGKRLSGFYEAEPATGPMGIITKMTRQSLAVGGTTQDFNLLPLIPQADFLQALHMFAATTNSAWWTKLTANGVAVHDMLDYFANRASMLGREMNPAAVAAIPTYDLVLDFDDPLNGALKMAGLNELTLHCEYAHCDASTYAVTPGAATGTMPTVLVHAGPPN